MLSIRINDRVADTQGTKFKMVLNSPAFSEQALVGDHSYSVSFPDTPNNRIIFGFQNRADIRFIPDLEFLIVINIHGNDVFSGKFILDKASDYFSGNIQAGATALIQLLTGMTTNQIDYGGTIHFPSIFDFKDYIVNAQNMAYPECNFTWFAALNRNLFLDAPDIMAAAWADILYTNLSDDLQYNYLDKHVLYQYLPFVINSIFKSSGYTIQSSVFNTGELSQLVLYAPFRLIGNTGYNHNPNDHVGKFNVIDLLNGIKKSFNVGFFIRHNSNRVDITPLHDLLMAELIDWTTKVVDIHARDFSYEYPDGHSYGYDWDPDCQTVDKLLNQELVLADYTILNPVSNRFVLGPASSSNVGNIRLVRNESAYFISELIAPAYNAGVTGEYQWRFFSYAFLRNERTDKERENFSTLSTIFSELPVDSVYPGYPIPVNDQAIIDPKGFKFDYFNYTNYWQNFNFTYLKDIKPKLLFYRGVDPESKKPFASCDYYKSSGNGTDTFNVSLDWNGTHGLFDHFHKDWVSFLDAATIHNFKVLLTVSDLMNLDLRKRIRIGPNIYIIRTISIDLPMDTPAEIEMMRINT